MSNVTLDFNSQLITNSPNKLIKLLVFSVGKLTLALPILQVQKVIKYNPLQGSGLSHVKLAHWEDREIAVVDLHQKLFNISLDPAALDRGYFIISKNITGEPLGILVAKSPILIELSTAQIRLIPESYRHADTLEIASHVTVVTQENETKETIFILDLSKLI